MIFVFIGFLFACAVFDIYYQKIPSVLIWSFIIIMAGYRVLMYVRGMSWLNEIAGLLMPGILLSILSCISSEIGKGDGLLIIATGCYLGGVKNIEMVLLAFLLTTFASIGILIITRSMKNIKIAFAPFLLAASIIIV